MAHKAVWVEPNVAAALLGPARPLTAAPSSSSSLTISPFDDLSLPLPPPLHLAAALPRQSSLTD